MTITDITYLLPKHPSKRYERRDLSKVNKIVVHHSATSSGDAYDFAEYHVQHNGWPGIGYHYVIAKNGTVFQTQHLTMVSYHATGANTAGIGICLVGNFDLEKPTPEQMQSLNKLVAELRDELGDLSLHAHNEYSAKSCPGKHFDWSELGIAPRRSAKSMLIAGLLLSAVAFIAFGAWKYWPKIKLLKTP